MALGQVNVPGAAGMDAVEAKQAAQAAKEAAEAAQRTAESAGKTAEAAMQKAADAETAAGNAGSKADEALNAANTAASAATAAASAASAAEESANSANTAANEAKTAANNAQKAANDALEAVTKLTSVINSVPTQAGILTYTGAAQSPSWNGYDTEKLTIGGTTSGTNAGSYVATFTPKEGYEWSDGTKTAKSVTWTISKASLSVPAQSGTLTYTGSAQSPQWSNYDSNKLTIGGTSTATNAGSYAATFTPKANYQWSDGSTSAKSVTWAIGKAAGSLTLAKSSVTLNISSLTESVAVTRAGDGVISATSSNTATARVEVSGTSVKITGLKAGTAKITVKVAAGTNHTAPSDKTINVTVSLPDTSLANNTPDIIAAAAKSGQAANYWSVGDKVGIAVNGSFGGLSYNNTVYAFILGFNHNSSVEGGNSIHFQFGKTAAGVDIAFVNSYGSTSTGFCMNTSNTNSGGWNNSYMRKTICPAFLAALPTAWRNIIAACTKYSDNTGGGSNTARRTTRSSTTITRTVTARSSTSTRQRRAPATGGSAPCMRATATTSAMCTRTGLRTATTPTFRVASRRALRWPNPKSGIESGAVGAQAPTSETPSTEYPNQHRPHPAGAATPLPVTGAPNRKGEHRNGSIQIAAQGRGGAIRGRRTRTAEGHGAHRTEVSGQLQVRDHGAAAATGERGLHERAQGKQHLRPQGHERAGLRAAAPLSGGGHGQRRRAAGRDHLLL